MADENKADPQAQKAQNIKIKIPEEIESGVYANAVSVHFNSNECIIDMAYRLTNTPEKVIKIVSRINMSHKTAESFLQVMSNALLDWKNRQKDNEKQQ